MWLIVLLVAATIGWFAFLTYLVAMAAGKAVALIFALLMGLTLFIVYGLLAGSKTRVVVEIDTDDSEE